MNTNMLIVAVLTAMSYSSMANAYTYKGESLLPAVYAFRCDSLTADPTIKDCPPAPGDPDPYGSGGGKLLQWDHSWIQLHNSSKVTFSAETDQIRLYLYDEFGQPAEVDDTACEFPVHSDPTGTYLDVLEDVLGWQHSGTFAPNETIFFFIPQCLNDGSDLAPDPGPPTSAVLRFVKQSELLLGSVTLWFTAGWEEGVLQELYGGRYYTNKAGSLIDKEKVTLIK